MASAFAFRANERQTRIRERRRERERESESVKMSVSENDPRFSDERRVCRAMANQRRAPRLSPATGTLILMKGREIAVSCVRGERAAKRKGGRGRREGGKRDERAMCVTVDRADGGNIDQKCKLPLTRRTPTVLPTPLTHPAGSRRAVK